jgi:hypothetical protein
MRHYLCAWMLLGGAVATIPGLADAQIFRRPIHGCCETCEMPHASCSCTQTRPVVQTQLRAQQVTTYRDVTETHVRNETVVQNVPVTTYKQVTVDEGGYQMVWVPKPVTKQVAQTVIQQQAQTRAVPYQVTRRVPQISTQLVPVQTVHHVTETVPMTTWAPPPVTFQAASSCNTCDAPFGTAFAPQFIAPQYGTAMAPPMQFAPATASIPTMPAISVPVPQTAQAPLPAPRNSTEQWQTIPSRPSASFTPTYDSPSRSVPIPTDEARTAAPRATAGRFVPAPTAATVWSSRAVR